jgi:hypothetical protein
MLGHAWAAMTLDVYAGLLMRRLNPELIAPTCATAW